MIGPPAQKPFFFPFSHPLHASPVFPQLQSEMREALALEQHKERAVAARLVRLETMATVRTLVDSLEAVLPSHLWTLATYHDLMFLDHTTD